MMSVSAGGGTDRDVRGWEGNGTTGSADEHGMKRRERSSSLGQLNMTVAISTRWCFTSSALPVGL